MKAFVGLILLLLGLSFFVVSFFSASRTDTVTDISFVLELARDMNHTRMEHTTIQELSANRL